MFEELEKEIEGLDQAKEENAAEREDLNGVIRELAERLAKMREEVQEVDSELNNKKREHNTLVMQSQDLSHRSEFKRKELATNKRNHSINEFLKEQPSFETLLEKEVISFIEESNKKAVFSTPIEATPAAKKLAARVKSHPFDDLALDYRAAEHQHKDALQKVAEMKTDGHEVPHSLSVAVFHPIEIFVRSARARNFVGIA